MRRATGSSTAAKRCRMVRTATRAPWKTVGTRGKRSGFSTTLIIGAIRLSSTTEDSFVPLCVRAPVPWFVRLRAVKFRVRLYLSVSRGEG
eukprot:2883624-Prymnesium_polylepis.2